MREIREKRSLALVMVLVLGVASLVSGLALGAPPSKSRAAGGPLLYGIHLGNTGDVNGSNQHWSDWLAPIDGDDSGLWPNSIVFLSKFVYDYKWDSGQISFRQPDNGVVDYLQRASAASVQIIIRIYESPGYFEVEDTEHHLLVECPPEAECSGRTPSEIANYILAIHNFNNNNGIHEWGFEPANEPNVEWYRGELYQDLVMQSYAWEDMDAYFAAIYDYVHENFDGSGTIRVLTPSMSQNRFAELDFVHLSSLGS